MIRYVWVRLDQTSLDYINRDSIAVDYEIILHVQLSYFSSTFFRLDQTRLNDIGLVHIWFGLV